MYNFMEAHFEKPKRFCKSLNFLKIMTYYLRLMTYRNNEKPPQYFDLSLPSQSLLK